MPQHISSEPIDARAILGHTFSRSFHLERGLVNTDERTVPLTFSSEAPVERWYGLEILDHSPEAADLTRLNRGAAVLVCHDRYDQIGAVVPNSAEIKDRRGHAVCKFSQSERGQEIQADVNDGIRNTTSFRYVPREMVLESSKDGVDTYRVTRWEPLEISFEPIPADISVGVGRSLESDVLRALPAAQKREALKALAEREGFTLILAPPSSPAADEQTGERAEERSQTPPPSTPPTTAAATTQPERTTMEPNTTAPAAPSAESTLRSEILALGDAVNQRSYAEELLLEDGITYETARARMRDRRRASQAANPTPTESAEDIASRQQPEAARSLPRVRLRHFTDQTEAYRFGQFLAAVRGNQKARQWCSEHGLSLQRAHSESDNESGGIFVPQEFSETLILLREKYGLARQFADVEPMGSSTKLVNRQKGGLTAYPSGARGTSRKVAESQMKFDSIELIARKWKVTTKLEEELTEDASMSVADKFAGESAHAFAKGEDDAFFNGDGTSAYHGIVGLRTKLRRVHNTIANIKGLVVASGNLFSEFTLGDFAKVVSILPAYADNENTAWYCHRTFFWNTIVPLMLAAGGTTVEQIENAPVKKFLSYPVRVSQVMPRTDANSQIPILLGDTKLSSLFGDRMGQQVRMTDTNDDDWDNDLLSMKAIERFDINHHDVGDTTEAGPVVGLISAAS